MVESRIADAIRAAALRLQAATLPVVMVACAGSTSIPEGKAMPSRERDAGAARKYSGIAMDGGGDRRDAATAVECGSPKQLSPTAITIMTPDSAPNSPTLVSSASGADVLAVWTDGGQIENGVRIPEAIWAVGLSLGASGADVALPIQLATDGHCPVVAATAGGFAVVWADATGLQLDRLDNMASTRGAPSLVLDVHDEQACPSALLDSDAGLVVAWYEPGPTNEMLARIDAKGHVVSKLRIRSTSRVRDAEVLAA